MGTSILPDVHVGCGMAIDSIVYGVLITQKSIY